MNLTDIDDKIIRGAAAEGITHTELADRYAARFLEDADALGMTRPDVLPRATEHIPQITDLVATLLDRGHAYRTDDGSIFFRIASWPAYGRLARLDPEAMRVGERVEADEYGKDDVRDFALWKGPKPGEPSWSTAIGDGRPGWHIECSAMSMAHLGPSFDIHTGGVDLVFPHHEDEIAQSEAATGQPFVRTWLHCAHLRMGGEKMAKSTGNIARVGELVAAGVVAPGPALRADLGALPGAAQLLRGVARRGRAPRSRGSTPCSRRSPRTARTAPTTPSCPASSTGSGRGSRRRSTTTSTSARRSPSLFDGVRELNRRLDARLLSTADAARATALIRDLDTVLGSRRRPEADLEPELQALLDQRVAARAARDWAASDRLRDELLARGIAVEDTRDGQRWRQVVAAGG